MKTETIVATDSIHSISELREYVNATLCEQNQLELDAFPLSERQLFQGGKSCGILFCLHGPRSIQLNAIWESTQNTIIFYSANGGKTSKVALADPIEFSATELQTAE